MERRQFLKGSSLAGMSMLLPFASQGQISKSEEDSIYLIGPQDGYSPHIGSLLSTMTMMRAWVISTVKDLSVKELDFQIDDQSNSIGAMLWHLAATEKYYQLNTFEGMDWGTWSEEVKKEWDLPMNLGEEGRKLIKGYDIDFYLEKLERVRETTKKEFAARNDDWIFEEEPFFNNELTNNYCKWFHVCEHESNHRGQMKFILKRVS